MTPAVARSEVREYLDAVRARLADLPPEEREDLLADTEASLLESAEEDDAPLAARLGPPERFADELRAAAGLEPAPRPASRLRLRELLSRPAVREALRTGRELAPVWWVVRAYVAVALFTMVTTDAWSVRLPAFPRAFGSTAATVLLLALAVAGSVWLARRERGRLAIAANLALAVAAVVVAVHVYERTPQTQYVEVGISVEIPSELSIGGSPVQNVYPYSRDGRLLQDVLLFDESGRRLDVRPAESDPLRRTLRTRSGETLFNAFPIRYFEPGTRRVADPAAGPPVEVPEIATPPLRPGR